ncbi:MAG: hypothetical protein IJT62_04270 [Oscillospiraceae bacterium]|nr:hypothetical protein [Oscillospiraceae bacterium]
MQKGEKLRREIYKQFRSGLEFNNKIELNDTVETNENFFIGKQWEGVQSNGLPKPVFNFLKRVTLHQVANITSDNIAMNATPLAAAPDDKEIEKLTAMVNDEFAALLEHNRIPNLTREYMRNAAVDGDGATYSWWDPDAEVSEGIKGTIRTEVIENTRMLFGNPNSKDVQSQPWIIIFRRDFVDAVRDYAEEHGASKEEAAKIVPDDDENQSKFESYVDDRCTVVLRLRRDKKTKTIWAAEVTKNAVVRDEWDLGIRLYPITWVPWDYVQDSYHGQSLITGLIPNQIYVNKMFAMVMISTMTTAYPKVVYDKTRIANWTNQVGAAIGVNGGDMNSVARIIDPAQVSPQISQFIDTAINYTQTFTGATAAALGDTRPDNTSAIIALQRAASIPSEITKQNLYNSIEDLGRIYLEFMAEYYGKRPVDVPIKDAAEDPAMLEFAGIPANQKVVVDFDFSRLKKVPMQMRLDVGASSYWSEIASTQTLDNLLQQDKIDLIDYLERIPEGYISKRQELIEKYSAAMAPAQPQMPMPGMEGAAPDMPPRGGGQLVDTGAQEPIPTTRGYSELQRKVNRTGLTE